MGNSEISEVGDKPQISPIGEGVFSVKYNTFESGESGITLHMIVGSPYADVIEWCKENMEGHANWDSESEVELVQGQTFSTPGLSDIYVVLDASRLDIDLINHESVHISWAHIRALNMDVSEDVEEYFARLVEFWSRTLRKHLSEEYELK